MICISYVSGVRTVNLFMWDYVDRHFCFISLLITLVNIFSFVLVSKLLPMGKELLPISSSGVNKSEKQHRRLLGLNNYYK